MTMNNVTGIHGKNVQEEHSPGRGLFFFFFFFWGGGGAAKDETNHFDLSRCPLLHKSLQPPLYYGL